MAWPEKWSSLSTRRRRETRQDTRWQQVLGEKDSNSINFQIKAWYRGRTRPAKRTQSYTSGVGVVPTPEPARLRVSAG